MSESVSIPIATFEVTVEYAKPNMKLLLERINIVDALFEGFKPWNIKVDDVEVISEGKPSEQGIKFRISSKRVSFFFGAAACKLVRDDSDWDSADETITFLEIGLSALTRLAGVEIGKYKTNMAMHLQLKTAPFMDVLGPLVPLPIASLDTAPAKAFAVVLKWADRRVTIDGSAQLANGIFLRLEREFTADETLQAMAVKLRSDEVELFRMLGVQEDRS